jgi:hypothetical protein
MRKDIFFECFPYVCPEPVLVKRSFLYINGSKSGVFLTWATVCHWSTREDLSAEVSVLAAQRSARMRGTPAAHHLMRITIYIYNDQFAKTGSGQT